MRVTTSKELIQLTWWKADPSGLMGEGLFEYDPDLKKVNHLGDTDTKNPIFFEVKTMSDYISDLLTDIVYDGDLDEWIIKGIDNQLNPKPFVDIFRTDTSCGEFTLVLEVRSIITPSTPMGPEEYDLEINCLGVLGLNYEIKEME